MYEMLNYKLYTGIILDAKETEPNQCYKSRERIYKTNKRCNTCSFTKQQSLPSVAGACSSPL